MAAIDERQREIEQLRARVASLERELVEQAARANAAVAAAQERTYWLDRLRIDPDRVMERPAMRALLAAGRAVRPAWRKLRGR